ncbi:recombinase family protein, partial [Patescibacteria group bacterium]|nr:recombinase family protein [Patescibacteria group bacterium]
MKQENIKTKYFLYARKSSESDDRQIQSIDDQVDRLKQLASDLSLDVKKIYTESKSAKKPNNRPLFDEMIQRIEKGEANGILCWHINRLSRNPIDQGRITWLLQRGVLKSIKTIEKEYLPEDNVLILGVEGGVANQFIIDLSKATKRGISRKVKNGWRPSRAPLGYINDKFGEKGAKKVLKDSERFALVRKMWDMVLTGDYCISQIRKMA